MREGNSESRIRVLLRQLRAVEEAAAPPFARVVAGDPGRQARRRRALVPALVVATALVSALGWLLARETSSRRSLAPTGLAAFYGQCPTDVLLAPPGELSAPGRTR